MVQALIRASSSFFLSPSLSSPLSCVWGAILSSHQGRLRMHANGSDVPAPRSAMGPRPSPRYMCINEYIDYVQFYTRILISYMKRTSRSAH